MAGCSLSEDNCFLESRAPWGPLVDWCFLLGQQSHLADWATLTVSKPVKDHGPVTVLLHSDWAPVEKKGGGEELRCRVKILETLFVSGDWTLSSVQQEVFVTCSWFEIIGRIYCKNLRFGIESVHVCLLLLGKTWKWWGLRRWKPQILVIPVPPLKCRHVAYSRSLTHRHTHTHISRAQTWRWM